LGNPVVVKSVKDPRIDTRPVVNRHGADLRRSWPGNDGHYTREATPSSRAPFRSSRWGSHRVGCRGRGASPAGPVRVEELAARPVHALVGVGAEVVALG